jgi:hypothetical protein
MGTFSPPHPAIDLATDLYRQLVHTLTDLLPPPLDDSPEAWRARNHTAIAKVAALLPVNGRHRLGNAAERALRIEGAGVACRARPAPVEAPAADVDRGLGKCLRKGCEFSGCGF